MDDSEQIFLICVLANFAVGFALVIAQLYLVYFRLDEIMACLSSSLVVKERRGLISKSPFGRLVVFWSVGMLLVFSTALIKSGGLDKGEFERFPILLGAIIRIVYVSSMVVGFIMLVLSAVGSHFGFI